jgi:hypothetical protein
MSSLIKQGDPLIDSDSDDDAEPPLLVALNSEPSSSSNRIGSHRTPVDASPCPVTIISGFLGR